MVIRGELVKNELEFQKSTGTKVDLYSLEPESKKDKEQSAEKTKMLPMESLKKMKMALTEK